MIYIPYVIDTTQTVGRLKKETKNTKKLCSFSLVFSLLFFFFFGSRRPMLNVLICFRVVLCPHFGINYYTVSCQLYADFSFIFFYGCNNCFIHTQKKVFGVWVPISKFTKAEKAFIWIYKVFNKKNVVVYRFPFSYDININSSTVNGVHLIHSF